MSDIEKIVFVPGLLCDEVVFDYTVEQLKPFMTTAVADLTTQDTITAMAKDTLKANPGKLVVVGHSMGARVAFEMVRLAPQRIRGLAVFDTGIHPYRIGEEIRRNRLVKLAYDKGMSALAERWLPKMVHPDRLADKTLMGTLKKMVERKTPTIHEQQIHALLNRPKAENFVGNITCPTLVGVGRQDAWSPVERHQQIQQQIKGSTLTIIENAGHFAPMEQPQVFTEVLLNWFKKI